MRHTVDFEDHHLDPGTAMWVRPGQVQQFSDERPTGDLVLFQNDFLIPGTRAAIIANRCSGPMVLSGSAASRGATERHRRVLRLEYRAIARGDLPSSANVETLRHLLSVLILSMDASGQISRGPDRLDSRFRYLLDREFATAHTVEYYASRLGYSRRSLNRATQATAGESPKQAISRRIALEARRLLAHTDQPVTNIARKVGFADPSNFAAFFAQQTNETPTAFRDRTRRR